MSDDSEQVAALIKELLILNREQAPPALEFQTARQVERRQSKRKQVRQDLVQVLDLRDREKVRS